MAAFGALAIQRHRSWKRALDSHLVLFVLISLVPTVAFYGYGVFVAGFLRWKVDSSILPALWLTFDYWRGWVLTAANAAGPPWIVCALLGLLLVQGVARRLLIGLTIGYVIFCLVFTYHIRFANYYHLQLLVIVALSIGPIASLALTPLRRLPRTWSTWAHVTATLLLALLMTQQATGQTIAAAPRVESRAVLREIGEVVGHSTRTLHVASYYGKPLEYYGELAGWYWPLRDDSAFALEAASRELSLAERLARLDAFPEYVVITDFLEFERYHADLKDYLATHCSLAVERREYLVYESCRM